MGRTGARLPGFCLNRIRPHVRVKPPPILAKPNQDSSKTDQKDEISGKVGEDRSRNGEKTGFLIGRKIMIVVDSSIEAKGALQWALSHTVQCHDTLVLLHVTKPSKQVPNTNEDHDKNRAPRASEPVSSLKNMCKQKRPEVEVEVAVVEGKEKGPTIVEEAKKQGVALLVLGQKKEVDDMASGNDVGRQSNDRWSSGILYPKCYLHGCCSQKEKQKTWRLFDHH
ncbi:universal stress protein PHOS32 [Gossypium australe]|uniref:Universal stress protein PHOS32 n=1 Tax=Gossypium australe TaxID=47621 RepID=A0A5B6U948_9ROSI|nr:universal stress protein PHOS32 [Gossypium australe]